MEPFVLTINGVFLGAIGVVAVVVLTATFRPDFGARAAHRYSVRARLPFGSDAVAVSVRHRLRTLTRANMWGVLVVIVLLSVIMGTTELGSDPQFLWLMAAATLLTLSVVDAVITVRERLIGPAPEALRVARPTLMRVEDYLGPWRRRTPVALLGIAALATGVTTALSAAGLSSASASTAVGVAMAIAVVAAAVTRFAERKILQQAQPASNTLELAWDDSFRSDALGYLRLAAALAAWLPIGLAAASLVSLLSGPAATESPLALPGFPWWGVALLHVLYTWRQGRLPDALHPDLSPPNPASPKGASA